MITDQISFFREPEPGRKIIREHLPAIAIHRDGSAMVDDTKWSSKRVTNALIMGCGCDQCDACLVAQAYLETINERQRQPLPNKTHEMPQ